MITLSPMFFFWVPIAIVGAILGFIIYGIIKGFDNTFPDD